MNELLTSGLAYTDYGRKIAGIIVEIAITERFWHDTRGLSNALANKCEQLIAELKQVEGVDLRQKALPGWRLHALRAARVKQFETPSMGV